MYRVIGGDLKEYGPATAEEVEHWIRDGRLSAQCLARPEDSSEWKPLGAFPEFAFELRTQAAAFPQPGTAVPPPIPPPEAWQGNTVPTPGALKIGDCMRGSLRLLRENFSLLFAGTFLVWMAGMLGQFVPFLGVIYWLVQGVLHGGLYLLFLRRIRGEPAAVGDVFAPFGFAFKSLAFIGLLTSALTYLGLLLGLLPGIFLYVIWAFAIPLAADKGMRAWAALDVSRKTVSRVWFPVLGLLTVAFLPTIVMNVVTELKISLAIYPDMKQIVGTKPLDTQRIMDLLQRVAGSTLPYLLATKLVLLLNLPFAMGAVAHAYEALFGTRPARKP